MTQQYTSSVRKWLDENASADYDPYQNATPELQEAADDQWEAGSDEEEQTTTTTGVQAAWDALMSVPSFTFRYAALRTTLPAFWQAVGTYATIRKQEEDQWAALGEQPHPDFCLCDRCAAEYYAMTGEQ